MDIALGGLEAVPGYVLQNVPMKIVYLYANRPIFSIGFLKGSKVQKVADMKGTKVGVVTLGSGTLCLAAQATASSLVQSHSPIWALKSSTPLKLRPGKKHCPVC